MKKYTLYQVLAQRYGLICGICMQSLLQEWEELAAWRFGNFRHLKRLDINIDIDHIVPQSLLPGQKPWADLTNLRLAHRTCNQLKANKIFTWEDTDEVQQTLLLPPTNETGTQEDW